MIGGLIDAVLGTSKARVRAFKPDTKAGTAAIRQQAEQAKAGAYGLAASQRGGMGSAAAIRGAQQAGVAANQNALQQQRQLEQSAADAHQRSRMAAEQQNVQIAQAQSNNLQKVAGLAVGAGMLMSDARAKKLEEENSVLKRMVGAITPQPKMAQRQMMVPEQNPIRNEAELAAAEVDYRTRNMMALREQAKQEAQMQQRMQRQQAEAERVRAMEDSFRQTYDPRVYGGDDAAVSDYRAKRMSDEQSKGGMSSREMEFPSGVKPVEYEYKDEVQGMPGVEPGKQFGVLAQDLEKSREGATVVEEDPETGLKMVDTPQLTMLLAAKTSEFEERLKRLEGSGRGRKA